MRLAFTSLLLGQVANEFWTPKSIFRFPLVLEAAVNNVIDRIAIAGYRSIRSIILRLGQLNVVTGANGSGKSNLYRVLRFLAATADGQLVRSLAAEGGFESVLWAGPKKVGKEPVRLRLGFTADPPSHCLDLGLPIPGEIKFKRDPELIIMRETLRRWRFYDAFRTDA